MTVSAQNVANLTSSEWLHAYEEDENGVEVYRPRSQSFPLSRRPRERLCCHADGTAEVGVGGPDDRSQALDATWCVDGDDVVVSIVNAPATRSEYRITTIGQDRLRVKVS